MTTFAGSVTEVSTALDAPAALAVFVVSDVETATATDLQTASPFIFFPLVFSVDMGAYSASAGDSPSGQNWSGAGYMSKYEIDTSIQISGSFINALTGVYVDPTVVTLLVLDPAGATTSFVYPTGTVTRNSLGHFNQQITPTRSGVWTYKWQATGAAIATSPDTTFTVNPSVLIAG